ncbi:hypothetical protein HOI83_01160 [Candidatus Uhrbacteria bacterium]|jgi:hypothetical protein|nr:hypothetical protein [Candidatus Uhrbacteria bacterium]
MKIPFKVVLPLVAIVLIFAFVANRAPRQVVSDAVTSEDGSAELVAFYDALASDQYEQAAQYIQPDCTERRCFAEGLQADEIAGYLEEMCKTSVCNKVEVDSVGEPDNDHVFVHTVAFLDEEGNRERLCVTEDCRVQKVTFAMRVAKIDSQWFVVDPPTPIY